VLSQNVKRRDLAASQRAAIAYESLSLLQDEAKDRQRQGGKDVGRGRPINSITFSAPGRPTPSFSADTIDFEIDNVAVLVNGSSQTESLFFFNGSQLGGLGIGDMTSTLLNQQGAQLYYGAEDNPTFDPGVYSLTNLALFNGSNAIFSDDFTLTISGSSQSVPEPSSALLLTMGLMGLAAISVARRKIVV
jgi:hypothetical protein